MTHRNESISSAGIDPSDKTQVTKGLQWAFQNDSQSSKEHPVKLAISTISLAVLVSAGCQQQASKPAMTDSAALDVAPAPAPVAYNPPAPVQTMTPDPALAGSSSSTASAASTGSYTIKKGDTLWKIAADHYGDGKKWHEIADANPGLSPSTLRIGQTISLP